MRQIRQAAQDTVGGFSQKFPKILLLMFIFIVLCVCVCVCVCVSPLQYTFRKSLLVFLSCIPFPIIPVRQGPANTQIPKTVFKNVLQTHSPVSCYIASYVFATDILDSTYACPKSVPSMSVFFIFCLHDLLKSQVRNLFAFNFLF